MILIYIPLTRSTIFTSIGWILELCLSIIPQPLKSFVKIARSPLSIPTMGANHERERGRCMEGLRPLFPAFLCHAGYSRYVSWSVDLPSKSIYGSASDIMQGGAGYSQPRVCKVGMQAPSGISLCTGSIPICREEVKSHAQGHMQKTPATARCCKFS
jgi:hypothetical protein